MDIYPTTIIVVTGPPNSGKSTLIRALGGQEHPISSIKDLDRWLAWLKDDIGTFYVTTNDDRVLDRLLNLPAAQIRRIDCHAPVEPG